MIEVYKGLFIGDYLVRDCCQWEEIYLVVAYWIKWDQLYFNKVEIGFNLFAKWKKYLCIYFLKYFSTKRECNLYQRNIIYKINLRNKIQFELKRNPQRMHHDK